MNPLDALRLRMGEHKESLSDYLMSGGPKDYEAYVKVVAKIETVDALLEDIAEIEQIFIED